MSKTEHSPAGTRPYSSPQASTKVAAIGQGMSHRVYWLLWGILICLYLIWPLTHLETYGWSNDEGLYLQRAALANAGYSLYTEAAFNKPPLLIWLLQLAFKIGGQTLVTGRLTILGLTLLGFIATGKVAQQLWGRGAGLFTAGLLLALPEVPIRAHVVTSDLPAVSFTMIAMWAALTFRCNGRLPYLILASLSATAGFLIHPLLIYMAAPLALILLWATPALTACAHNKVLTKKEFAFFIVSALLFVLLTLAAIEWRTFFQWVFTNNVAIAQSESTFSLNWDWVVTTLMGYWPLGWLAVVGTLTLITSPGRNNFLIIFTWFIAVLAVLLVWSPLWEHYRLLLAYPLVMVAGGGLATLVCQVRQYKSIRPQIVMPLALLSLTGLILFGVIRWQETKPYLVKSERQWTAAHLAVRAFLRDEIASGALVATDDPLLAFTADRLVSPAFTEATLKMINTGIFSLGDAIESTLSYQAPSVIFATGRLDRLSDFEEWTEAIATQRRDFGSIRVYTLPAAIAPAQPTIAQLGEGLRLQGFSLSSHVLQPGEPANLTLFWQRNGPVHEDYHVFIHVVDHADEIVAQLDGPPISQDYPTHEWAEGLLLPDPRTIEIGDDISPGTYRVIVGMYEWPSLVRLPASHSDGSRWPDDRILLTEVTVSAN